MSNYVITFPQTDKTRRDGWIRIVNAKNVNQVKNFADHEYKDGYALIYEEEQFLEGHYPQGCLEEVDLRTWHDYVT